jgi:predicted outer membrane protein
MRIAAVLLLTALCLPCDTFAETKRGSGSGSKTDATSSEVSSSKGKSQPKKTDPAAAGTPPAGLITTDLGGNELQFFQDAFALGTLESWLGGEAKARGEGDRVKALGEALQETQTEETQLLVRLARRKGVELKLGKTMPERQARAKAQLASLQGAQFDAAILELIVATTREEADVYARAAGSTDPDVKRFVEQISSIVNDKLTLASRVSGKPLPPGATPGFRENTPVPPTASPAPAKPEKPATTGVPAKPAGATTAATPARGGNSTPPVAPAKPQGTPAR